MGLGLASVRSIVEAHSGWVEVKSLPGKGTTFEIFFPAGDEKKQKSLHQHLLTVERRIQNHGKGKKDIKTQEEGWLSLSAYLP
jgi:hypothetical protein